MEYSRETEKKQQSKFFSALSRNILLVLIVAIFSLIVVIGPLRNYFSEVQNANALGKELQRAQKQKEQAEIDFERWNDDKFVIAYARDNYGMIQPGETAMLVLNADKVGHEKDIDLVSDDDTEKAAELAAKDYRKPWYERMGESIILPDSNPEGE